MTEKGRRIWYKSEREGFYWRKHEPMMGLIEKGKQSIKEFYFSGIKNGDEK